MVDNKVWVQCLMRDKGALSAFQAFLDDRYKRSAQESVDHFKNDDFESMRSSAAVAVGWEIIRNQISMYIREEEQHGIIQQQG